MRFQFRISWLFWLVTLGACFAQEFRVRQARRDLEVYQDRVGLAWCYYASASKESISSDHMITWECFHATLIDLEYGGNKLILWKPPPFNGPLGRSIDQWVVDTKSKWNE